MDQPELEGLRLLSFDGGDIRAVSQLIILDEFMRRVEWDTKAENRILPCEYFHMMAGVGTGGIIIFLLVILRMSIEEAIEEFITIWHTVYVDATFEPKARSMKLENVLRDLLRHKGIQENQVFSTHKSSCKAFVCAVPESNLVLCEKFRNYKSKETSITPTIVEAIRATCAIPTLFTSVTIESIGCELSYTTGAFKFNNPAGELLKEACEHLGRNTRVACMLSLGCASLSAHQSSITDLTSGIVSDSELLDVELAWRIGRSGAYYRLSARQQTQSSGPASSGSIEIITATTKGFLAHPDVVEKVDQSVEASRRRGGVPLAEISGLSERRPTAAHGLPPLSASFVERPALIKTMAGYLLQSGPPAQRIIVLSGLGGIGKTQITISFLLQFLAIFRHVLFIDGSSVQTIESSLVAKVKSLGSSYSRTTAKEALDVLENPDHEITRDWAIVYDNVDDPSVRIATYFPKCAFGTIFITTRNPKLGNLAPNAHLHLDTMSEGEAVEVLLKSAIRPPRTPTDEEEKHAREIAKQLGYLPVALVQAGYFIQVHDCMGDYSRRLRKRRPDILKRPAEHQRDDHYHGVYATLEVTWPYLSDRAQNFMSILGFVNYTGFPLMLISRAVLHGFLFEPSVFMSRPNTFQQSVQLLCSTFMPQEEWDQQDIDDLVEELERYSLVTRMSTFMVNTLRLHPLVHSWVHDRLSNAEKQVYQAAAVRLLVCGTGDADEDIFEFIYPHITSWSDRLESLHLNDLAGLARIFAHQGDHTTAVALWEHIHQESVFHYGTEDIRASEAKLQLAASYRKAKYWEKMGAAADMEREVLTWRRRNLGPEDPLTVRASSQKAQGLIGRWDEAISILRKALEFWETRSEDDPESVLRAKEALAAMLFEYHNVHTAKEVIQIYTELLQDRMKRNGADHFATVRATEALATAYGQYARRPWWKDINTAGESVVELWSSVMEAKKRRRGIYHPDTLDAMECLTWSYYAQCEYQSFLDHWRQLFVFRRNAQGPTHDKVLTMTKTLAGMKSDVWVDRNAEIALRKAEICIIKENRGRTHMDTIEAMERLAEECEGGEHREESPENDGHREECEGDEHREEPPENGGHREEALGLRQEIFALRKEVQGIIHKETLESMKSLARIYDDCGKHEQAKSLRKEAIVQIEGILALRKEIQGTNHKDTLACMESLVTAYRMGGQQETVVTLWKDVIAHTKELPGSTYMDTIGTIERVARECTERGEYKEAIELWKEVLALRKDIQGITHKDTLACMESLTGVYLMHGRHEMAVTLWKDVIAQNQELYGSAYTGTIEALERVAWRREGRPWARTEAPMWWKMILALRKKIQGPQHEDTINSMEILAAAYENDEQNEEAILQWKEALALRAVIQGTNHEDTLACMESLARTYHTGGQHEMAITRWKDVVVHTKELHGRAHEDTINCTERFARTCRRWSLYKEARAQWKELLGLLKETRGPQHEDTLNAMEECATACEDSEEYEEALLIVQEVLALRKEGQGISHYNTLRCMESLARMYKRLHLYEEAEVQWKEMMAAAGETRYYKRAKGGLSRLYTEMGRKEEANLLLADASDRGADGFRR